MKRFIWIFAGVLLASNAGAAKFSVSGQGTSTINANGTGDYLSLAEAAADFTGYAGGSTGDWNLLIETDLDETTASLFGNNTNGHSVTLRPAPGTSVTVSFTFDRRFYDDTGGPLPKSIWDGNIVIGPDKSFGESDSSLDPEAIHYMDVDNFTIDGCNTPGGTERNLTLWTPEISTTAPAIPRYMIRFVGCDSPTVRNTTIIQDTIGNGETGYTCILFNARYISEGALLYLPNNALVENCGIYAYRGNTGRGVWADMTGGAPTSLDAIHGMVVTNNDIHVSHRAIQYGGNAGGEISYNRIRITQEIPGRAPQAVIHTGSNGVLFPFTTNIIGNHILGIRSEATNGFNYAIALGGVIQTNPGPVVFNVVNNMIGGLTGTAEISTAGGLLGRAIALETNSQHLNTTYNIRHNSISMQDIPNYGPGLDDSQNRMGVLSFYNSSTFAGTMNFENNIVSYRQHNGSVINSRDNATVGGFFNFNNNTYHLANGAKLAEINGTVYNTLAEWQASGRDLGSNTADPFAPPSGGKWFSDVNLHFDAEPAAIFKTTAIAGADIDLDFDQDARATTGEVTKGADEYVEPPAGVNDWAIY